MQLQNSLKTSISLFFITLICFIEASLIANPLETHYYQGATSQKLDNDWKMFWGQLYHQDSTIIQSDNYIIVNKPERWNGLNFNGQELSADGYATYYTEIVADKDYDNLAIYLPGFYSAQNTYLNSVKISFDGMVGTNAATSSVAWTPVMVEVSLHKGVNQLILEVSNFHHFKGGFYLDVSIGHRRHYAANFKQGLMIDLFTAGAFIMIGIFFLGIFLFWKHYRLYIIYTVFTFSYAVRILSSGDHVLNAILLDMPWQWAVGLEYFSLFLVWWSSLAINAELFPKKLYSFISYYYICLMLLVVILPLKWYSQLLTPAIFSGILCYLVGFTLLFIRKKHTTWRGFLAMLFFFIFAFAGWLLEFLAHSNILFLQSIEPNVLRFLAVLALGFLVSERYSIDYDELAKLKSEAESREKTIASQMVALTSQQGQLLERNQKIETLLREVHHRVKNNLQLIYSLLNVQSTSGIDKSKNILEDSRGRVATMSLIHQNLYENNDLKTVILSDYIDDLTVKIREVYNIKREVNLHIQCDDYAFDIDTIIPLGLIITELMTNAFKYGFKKEEPLVISISLKESGANYTLSIADNGPNLPDTLPRLMTSGYGLKLAGRLAKQLQGSLEHTYNAGNIFQIHFKDTPQRKQIL